MGECTRQSGRGRNLRAIQLMVIALMPVMTGCQMVITFTGGGGGGGLPGGGFVPPGNAGTLPPTTFNPTGTVAPSGLPPAVNLPGQSGAVPPAANLPVPAESQSLAQTLMQRYGIRAIVGSYATPQALMTLDQGLSRLPRGTCQNLEYWFEPSAGKSDMKDVLGYWTCFDARNRDLFDDESIPGDAAVLARIYFMQENTTLWTMVHETMHHYTLFSNANFGRTLAPTLGYTVKEQDKSRFAMFDVWDPTNTPESAYPTTYAKDYWSEHEAEIGTYHTIGPDAMDSDGEILSTFTSPASAAQALRQGLGAGFI